MLNDDHQVAYWPKQGSLIDSTCLVTAELKVNKCFIDVYLGNDFPILIAKILLFQTEKTYWQTKSIVILMQLFKLLFKVKSEVTFDAE